MSEIIEVLGETQQIVVEVEVPGPAGPAGAAGADGADGTGGGEGGSSLPADGTLVYGKVDQYPYVPLGDVDDIIVLADVEGVRFLRIGDQLDQSGDLDDSVQTNYPWQVTADAGITVTDVTTASSITVPPGDGSTKYVRKLAGFDDIVHNIGLRSYITAATSFPISTIQMRIGLILTGLTEVVGGDPVLYLIDPGGIRYTPEVIPPDGSYTLIESADGATMAGLVAAFKSGIEGAYEGSHVEIDGLYIVAPTSDQEYSVQVLGRYDTDQREKTTTLLTPALQGQLQSNLNALQTAVADLTARVEALESP